MKHNFERQLTPGNAAGRSWRARAVVGLVCLLVGPVTLAQHDQLLHDSTLKPGTKNRVIVMADMGNEPDEEQQLVHMMTYANRVEFEGLLAVTGKYKPDSVDTGLLKDIVKAYEEVRNNLQAHTRGTHYPDWPEGDVLQSVIRPGAEAYGCSSVGEDGGFQQITPPKSDGSDLIKKSLRKNLTDPRPLYIIANAGTNNLYRALHDLEQEVSEATLLQVLGNTVVYENGAQDDCGVRIALEFPDIRWHRSNFQTYAYGSRENGNYGRPGQFKDMTTTDGPHVWGYSDTPYGQHQWAAEHIQSHGPLGAMYPERRAESEAVPFFLRRAYWYLEGGGTSPFMAAISYGLSDISSLSYGGWGGRFSKRRIASDSGDGLLWSRHDDTDADVRSRERFHVSQSEKSAFQMFSADGETDLWTDPVTGKSWNDGFYETRNNPIWRFRRAMFNDFAARMDWSITDDVSEVNHNPVAVINGDMSNEIVYMDVEPGQDVSLSAAGSYDPDAQDSGLSYLWSYYKEAGTYDGNIMIAEKFAMVPGPIQIPADAVGDEIHILLGLRDNGVSLNNDHSFELYDHRRVVLRVKGRTASQADQLTGSAAGGALDLMTVVLLMLGLGFARVCSVGRSRNVVTTQRADGVAEIHCNG